MIKTRRGRCYELAIKHLLDQGEGTLVHIKVWSRTFGMFIGHALVETETGFIYEPVVDRYFEKEWLFRTYKVEEFKRYTVTETIKMCLKHKNYGPWDSKSAAMPSKGV